MNVARLIAQDLSVNLSQVEAALSLFTEGATIPFVARYRKERTGELDEIQLRQIKEQATYFEELIARKSTVLDAIEKQGMLTSNLRQKIESTLSKTELEDLYLPFRPKRRTRAAIAREKGLEGLAEEISQLNLAGSMKVDLRAIAQPYLSDQVKNVDEALQGAADILAEAMAEQADLRSYVRNFFIKEGQFVSKIKSDYAEGSTKYEMYRSYRVAVRKVAPHNLLALLRGDKEGVLKLLLDFDEAKILEYLLSSQIRSRSSAMISFYRNWVKDGFRRLMKTSLTNEVIAEKKAWADEESIHTFAENLRNLLLSAPAGMKPTLGIDPGFRTGCKVAAVSETGQFLEYLAIYPHSGQGRRLDAANSLARLIDKHRIELIAIGNGTASRETDAFVAEVIAPLASSPVKVIVNESGASIYSASEVAICEFPDLDVTVRGAISIARRLQDPLAELVKLDPKSIGVGQYQHDVDQRRLKQKLDETVESCVNYVGVDLNTASKELLEYVSGISQSVASNIVSFRNEVGHFRSRQSLLKVSKLGPKAFEQAAGFLRIRSGDDPLDNTAVHPERYGLIKQMATDLHLPLTNPTQLGEALDSATLKRYVTHEVGAPTLNDIARELKKPGRDPRAEFTYAHFAEGVNEIKDLSVGMILEGVVTNVANFGAFVDVGVHQDGLVHISQMADRFVKDPKEIVQVGQIVKVRVMEIQEALKRIGLSMRIDDTSNNSSSGVAASLRGRPSESSADSAKNKGDSNTRKISKPTLKPTLKQKTERELARSKGKQKKEQSPRRASQFSSEDLENRFNRRKP